LTDCTSITSATITCNEICQAQGGACAEVCGSYDGGYRATSITNCMNGEGLDARTCDDQLDLYVAATEGARCCCTENTTCLDGGVARSMVRPSAGELVITEVHADPSGTDNDREWLEVYVAFGRAVDLNGITIVNNNGTNTRRWGVDSTSCLEVPTHGYAVIAGPNALLDGLVATATTAALPLYNSSATLSLTLGDVAIDSTVYPAPTSGASSSLKSSGLSAAGNDTIANWCASTVVHPPYTDKGTPGAVNDPCP
jgi:hypothetical protein